MTYTFIGWLQAQGLPQLADVERWAFYGIGGWMAVQTWSNGKALAFLKGNTPTKDQLSAAVDRIRNDVTAANLDHRREVEKKLGEFDKRTERRAKAR